METKLSKIMLYDALFAFYIKLEEHEEEDRLIISDAMGLVWASMSDKEMQELNGRAITHDVL